MLAVKPGEEGAAVELEWLDLSVPEATRVKSSKQARALARTVPEESAEVLAVKLKNERKGARKHNGNGCQLSSKTTMTEFARTVLGAIKVVKTVTSGKHEVIHIPSSGGLGALVRLPLGLRWPRCRPLARHLGPLRRRLQSRRRRRGDTERV